MVKPVRAGVAQLVEHLICNQRVGGSNPFASSTFGTPIWSLEQQELTGVQGNLSSAGPVLRGDPTEVHAPKCRRLSGRGVMCRRGFKNGDGRRVKWVSRRHSGSPASDGCPLGGLLG